MSIRCKMKKTITVNFADYTTTKTTKKTETEVKNNNNNNIKTEKEMKKYEVIISSAKDVKLLNDKIAIDSLFTVGETITNNPLHVGINVVTDERIKDSMRELANKRGYRTNKN